MSTIKKGFKGFNKDLTCREFQFKEGESFEHKGEVELCQSGFHFCENPLACFHYYSPGESVFHVVEVEGVSEETGEDSKRAALLPDVPGTAPLPAGKRIARLLGITAAPQHGERKAWQLLQVKTQKHAAR